MQSVFVAAKELLDYAIAERRHFHRYPELSGFEFDTMRHIATALEELGIPFVNIPDGGILGHIDGVRSSRSVLLRADCDALPIEEMPRNNRKERTCISIRAGVSHMCGHDAHMAMLLAAAKLLLARRETLCGRVYLLFERGEEGTNNIYWVMRHLLENQIHIDGALALHVDGSLPTGVLSVREGAASAGAGGYVVTLTGRGGHGSRPDEANNPIDCFVAIYNRLKELRMREISPFTPFTDDIGVVQSGTKGNVIPETLRFSGTFRFFDMAAGQHYYDRLCAIVQNAAAEYGCTAQFDMRIGPSCPLMNDAACCRALSAALEKALPAGTLQAGSMNMGSESFATYAAYYPAVYAWLGTGNAEKGTDAPAHHPAFDIDEDALAVGVAAHVAFAEEFLSGGYVADFTPCAEDIDSFTRKTNMCFPPRRDGEERGAMN